MPATRLLFFDGAQVTAMCWQGGRIDIEGRFANTPVGQEALVRLCLARDLGPLMFLADIAEEGFQLENIPHLQGADRAALITRRLGQYFYGTPFATAISLGRETSGRRDERVQFAALTRPEMITPWVECLRAARVPLRGVYSLPLVLAKQKLAFAAGEKRFILVTVSQGGLRQTFFDDGQMRFSRLTQLPNTRVNTIGSTCSRETTKTVQYLLGQRSISRGARLPVFFIAHPDHHIELREQCPDVGDVNYVMIDLVAGAATLGYKSAITDSHSDTVLAHFLARNPPREQFAPASDRQMFRLWQIRFGLRAAAAAFLAAGLLAGGKLMLDASLLNSESERLDLSIAGNQQRYQDILSGLPLVSVTPANLRAVLSGMDELAQHAPEVRQALAHLGTTLTEFPGIDLKRLKWEASDKAAIDPKQAANATASAIPGAPSSSPAPITPASAWSILEIEGTLPLGLHADQRRQIELIGQFVKHLQRAGALVRVITMPVEIQSDKAMRSDDRPASSTESKVFVLQLSVPFPPVADPAPASGVTS